MKKKTIFKVLPALLIAPVLVLCIAGFAMANEGNDQTIFNKINYTIDRALNSLFVEQYEDIDFAAIPNAIDLESDDELFYFDTFNGDEAILTSFGSAWNDEDAEIKTKLEIPIYVTDKNGTGTYRVTKIGESAFQCQRSIEAQGNKITEIVINGWDENGNGGWLNEIQSHAFQRYSSYLETVTLPDFIDKIGYGIFNNDLTLKTIKSQNYTDGRIVETVGLPSQLKTLGQDAFADCQALTFNEGTLILPSSLQGAIGSGCFYECYGIKNISFNTPNITAINGGNGGDDGTGAFQNCINLTAVDLSKCTSLTTIGPCVFCNDYKLDNIQFNSVLYSVGDYCFAMQNETSSANSSLEYIYLPESVSIIGIGAFQNSTKLKEIIIGMKDSSNSNIHTGAFSNLPSLISITFLWNAPRDLDNGAFLNSPSQAYAGDTPAFDLRFRPLRDSDYGGWGFNYWLDWKEKEPDQTKFFDRVLPENSRLVLSAVFDEDKYGNDLQRYLNESSGKFDNGTLESKNSNMERGVKYNLCITLPDSLTLRNTGVYETNVSQTDSSGARSKGIDFVFNSTKIHQTTHQGESITRPADNGILTVNNNAIQVNTGNTLHVTYNKYRPDETATKQWKTWGDSPCITGHTIAASELTEDKLDRATITGPVLLSSGQEGDAPCESSPLDAFDSSKNNSNLLKASNSNGYQPTLQDTTIFYTVTKSVITLDMGYTASNNKVIAFQDNTAWCSCVYNSGIMDMQNCYFTGNKGKWGQLAAMWDPETVWGGSCVFNNGSQFYNPAVKEGHKAAEIINCNFENNQSLYRGGTIYNVGDLLIEETSITGSRTTASAIANAHTNRAFAGAIYDNHGGVSYEGKLDGNLYLNSAWIENNTAAAICGGIYSRNGGTINLSDKEGKEYLHMSGNKENGGSSTCDIALGPGIAGKGEAAHALNINTDLGGAMYSYIRVVNHVKENIEICKGGHTKSLDGNGWRVVDALGKIFGIGLSNNNIWWGPIVQPNNSPVIDNRIIEDANSVSTMENEEIYNRIVESVK